jgi:transcription elongation factor SPT5
MIYRPFFCAFAFLHPRFYFHESQSAVDPTVAALLIKSAFTNQMTPGYLYVEAEKEAHVKAAIDGVRFVNKYFAKLVALEEMCDCLNTPVKLVDVNIGQWVRMKRGDYKDDLGQIAELHDGNAKATVKLIPRIDYAKLSQIKEEGGGGRGGFGKGRAKRARPPARLFQRREIEQLGGTVEIKAGSSFYTYASNKYKKDGFLYKTVVLDSLVIEGVTPSPSEIELFSQRLPAGSDDEEDEEAGGQSMGMKTDPLQAIAAAMSSAQQLNAASAKATSHAFVTGTLVRNFDS